MHKDGAFQAEIGGKTFTERKDADAALEAAVKDIARGDEKRKLGSVQDFDLYSSWVSVWRDSAPQYWVTGKSGESYDVNPSMASIEGKLRRIANHAKEVLADIEDKKGSIERMNAAAATPFGQADLLVKKKQQLADLLADLHRTPSPPPAWLVQGAPVQTDIYIKDPESFYGRKKKMVEGHKWGEKDFYVITTDGDVPYMEAMNEDGNKIYEPRPFQSPVTVDTPEMMSPGPVPGGALSKDEEQVRKDLIAHFGELKADQRRRLGDFNRRKHDAERAAMRTGPPPRT
jgi:hypothetical protein